MDAMTAGGEGFSPDGLDLAAINGLLAESHTEVRDLPGLTSWHFLSTAEQRRIRPSLGTAERRREWRAARRAERAVVRSLPVQQATAFVPDGTEAA